MSVEITYAADVQSVRTHNDPAFLKTIADLLRDATGLLEKDHAALAYLSRAHALLAPDAPSGIRMPARSGGRQVLAPWQATRVQRYIEEHMESGIRIDDLIALTRLSASYFFRAFKGSFGMSPHAYVVKTRIERAQTLLMTTDEQLCQIALAVGLTDQAHLSRLFRQQTGCPPGVWRREARGGIYAPPADPVAS